jgi:hypothetical protein
MLEAIQAEPWWALLSTWRRAHSLDDPLVCGREVVDVVAVLLARGVVYHL